MPRHARQKSETGYLHLITRGVGRQALFESREDYRMYLSLLERCSRETDVAICAYCLMENHVHLLVRDERDHTALMMKKLGVSYARYFNRKYERTGHLFQDRYLSEPIRDEPYLLTVFRYILNNPRKAGICAAKNYEWSSYRLYGRTAALVDTSLLAALIGDAEAYAAFVAAANDDECLEYDRARLSDKRARRIVQEQLGHDSGTALQALGRKERDAQLRALLDRGLSIRQIERLTGISRGIVQKVR